MPSPLTHIAAGYGAYLFSRKRPEEKKKIFNAEFFLVLAASLFPDLDAAAGFVGGSLMDYHNNWTHSFFSAVFVSTFLALFFALAAKKSFIRLFALSLICYLSHILLDFLTVGRGLMLLWPFSETRFSSPVNFFYGLRWSEGWISRSHIITLANELSIIVPAVLLSKYLSKLQKNTRAALLLIVISVLLIAIPFVCLFIGIRSIAGKISPVKVEVSGSLHEVKKLAITDNTGL